MGKYIVKISKEAEQDLKKLKKSGRKSDIKKVGLFFEEIEISPKKGLGHPKPLTDTDGEVWSRKINDKDRFVYRIFENENLIVVMRSLGHYQDK